MSSRNLRTMMTLFLLFTAAANARPADSKAPVDISPLVEHFRKQVKTLTRPVTTYSWSPRTDIDNRWVKLPWGSSLQDSSPSGQLKETRDAANLFWRLYNNKSGQGYMYGTGLYTAVDPAATQENFAGKGDDWQVFEVTLPKGAQILDLANHDNVDTTDANLSAATKEILGKFNCPAELDADKFFVSGGTGLDLKCAQLIYHVFKRILKIDAFAYSYGGTNYRECESSYNNMRAFVVTSSDWINAGNARIYRPTTTGFDDDRIRIQTLLLKAVTANAWLDTWSYKQLLISHFDQYPDRDMTSTRTVCSDAECVIHAEFCDDNKACDEIEVTRMARPGGPLINAEEAVKTRLLWPDLIGRPKSTTVATWLKKSTFACGGTLPYETGKAK